MFRRRPFRGPALGRRRPPLARPSRRPLPPRVRQALIHANRSMEDGRFAEAARIFDRLSGEADRFGMPIRAANLKLRSSRAYFAAGDIEAALGQAEQALRLFIANDQAERVPVLLSRMTSAMREKGYDAQADHLQQEVERLLDGVGLSLDEARQRGPTQIASSASERGSLPSRCSGCGVPLVPDEVEWHDPYTAECLYCGTIVKAT
jgi:tetratricopeptide (TPR) repeat protein